MPSILPAGSRRCDDDSDSSDIPDNPGDADSAVDNDSDSVDSDGDDTGFRRCRFCSVFELVVAEESSDNSRAKAVSPNLSDADADSTTNFRNSGLGCLAETGAVAPSCTISFLVTGCEAEAASERGASFLFSAILNPKDWFVDRITANNSNDQGCNKRRRQGMMNWGCMM